MSGTAAHILTDHFVANQAYNIAGTYSNQCGHCGRAQTNTLNTATLSRELDYYGKAQILRHSINHVSSPDNRGFNEAMDTWR